MKLDITRAWKDELYRLSLSEAERYMLPENPVGEIELTDADLAAVYGAGGSSESGHSHHEHDHEDKHHKHHKHRKHHSHSSHGEED